MSDITIKLDNVSKYYKLYGSPKERLKEALHPLGKTYHEKFYALSNINLEVKKGEILGIVGRNGSGKSTLLKIISSVLIPDQGKLRVAGKISALLELGAGFNPEFTGKENIYFYGTILGLSRKELEDKYDKIASFADIGKYLEQPVKSYSSGMKARLGFAVAAHINPEILILDEVLSVGDVLFQRKCYQKMQDFFQSGKTIIYVSHNVGTINELCTRAIFIDNGSILLDGSPSDVTKYYLKYMYAKEKDKIAVKNEIIELAKNNALINGNYDKNNDVSLLSSKKLKAYFIKGFVPKSTVEYRNENVEIYDAKILSESGEKVNVLIHGETYTYSVKYKSKSDNDFFRIAFGLEINDLKGVKVSSIESMSSHLNGLYRDKLIKGEEVTLSTNFRCIFKPGDYFINNGVSDYSGEDQKILNRIVDIICFKVIDDGNSLNEGYANVFRDLEITSDVDNHKIKKTIC